MTATDRGAKIALRSDTCVDAILPPSFVYEIIWGRKQGAIKIRAKRGKGEKEKEINKANKTLFAFSPLTLLPFKNSPAPPLNSDPRLQIPPHPRHHICSRFSGLPGEPQTYLKGFPLNAVNNKAGRELV